MFKFETSYIKDALFEAVFIKLIFKITDFVFETSRGKMFGYQNCKKNEWHVILCVLL